MTTSRLICSEPACGAIADRDAALTRCASCGGLLEFVHELETTDTSAWRELWSSRLRSGRPCDRSGVWRFRELLPEFGSAPVITLGEGRTPMPEAPRTAAWSGVSRLATKHLGANPTGSFKDLGMTVAISEAVRLGKRAVACASTGNTSASMAAFAARAGLRSVVFVPRGAVSLAKLAQALDFGGLILEAGETFDQAFATLRELAPEFGLYLVNSINPLRIEGQKTAILEILEQRDWQAPDFVALPGGNLGNCSAIGKGLRELQELGWLDRMPRVVVTQAEGASPFHRMWRNGSRDLIPEEHPATRATAIRIGSPANWSRARRVLDMTNGLTAAVSEQEIAAAKRQLALEGIGCEPASAAAVAGVRQLRQAGEIPPDADVVAILTGHQLKDPQYITEVNRAEADPGPRHDLRAQVARWLSE